MVEGLALAGMMELPIVILIGQRPGPATGLPTRTAQQDLLFALHAGHGEFVRAIFAPGSIRQSYDLTRRAVETAHQFQSPVLILTDQFLQDMQKNIPPLDDAPRPIDRRIVTGAASDYVRYAVTDSGVSPRAIPGGEAFVVCDSDEHLDDGHITEDLEARIRQQDKRMRKLAGLTRQALAPERYGPEGAENVLVAWGSSYGPCREAVDILNAHGGSFALAHFAQVWPVNAPAARAILAGRRVICVEGNFTGQFASLLHGLDVIGPCDRVLRYDGLPLTAEYIVRKVLP
jgi:2-oxoglutarate ferredoxin oxidoreductase subunit alpha